MDSRVFLASIYSSALTGWGVYRSCTVHDGRTLIVDVIAAVVFAFVITLVYKR